MNKLFYASLNASWKMILYYIVTENLYVQKLKVEVTTKPKLGKIKDLEVFSF